MFDHITASEIAGYGVGTAIVCLHFCPKNRRSHLRFPAKLLGCGDLRMIAYSRCNRLGLAKGGPFTIIPVNDQYQSFGGGSKPRSIACTKCQSKRVFRLS